MTEEQMKKFVSRMVNICMASFFVGSLVGYIIAKIIN